MHGPVLHFFAWLGSYADSEIAHITPLHSSPAQLRYAVIGDHRWGSFCARVWQQTHYKMGGGTRPYTWYYCCQNKWNELPAYKSIETKKVIFGIAEDPDGLHYCPYGSGLENNSRRRQQRGNIETTGIRKTTIILENPTPLNSNLFSAPFSCWGSRLQLFLPCPMS